MTSVAQVSAAYVRPRAPAHAAAGGEHPPAKKKNTDCAAALRGRYATAEWFDVSSYIEVRRDARDGAVDPAVLMTDLRPPGLRFGGLCFLFAGSARRADSRTDADSRGSWAMRPSHVLPNVAAAQPMRRGTIEEKVRTRGEMFFGILQGEDVPIPHVSPTREARAAPGALAQGSLDLTLTLARMRR